MREHPCLEAVLGVVDRGERRRLVVRLLHGEHRSEDLLAGDRHVGRYAGEDGRRVGGAVALAARQERGPGVHGLLDPGLDALGRVLADQRADVGLGVGRVAGDLGLDGGHDARQQTVVHGRVRDDPLHGDAGLAALVVGEGGDAGGGPVEVGVGGVVAEDDRGAVAAQLQGAVLARHRVHDRVADLLGTGEGDDRQPLVLDQGGHLVVGDREDAPGTRREFGLGEQFADDQAGERGGGGRLQDDRHAGCDRRGDLVGAQVQREVEGRDAEDDALGEAAGEGETALTAGVGVEALGLTAVEPPGLLRGEPEDGDGAADLAAGPLERLAVLGGDQLGDLLGALDEPAADVVERGGPDMRGRRGEVVEDGVGGGDRLLDLGIGRHGDRADEPAVPRGGDVEGVLARGLAAGEPEGGGGSHRGPGPSASGGVQGGSGTP